MGIVRICRVLAFILIGTKRVAFSGMTVIGSGHVLYFTFYGITKDHFEGLIYCSFPVL